MPSSEAEHVRRLYRAIYSVVRRIPAGRVATYGQVAELAGIPGGARVAGAAMKTSTATDGLPWQRVIAKAGRTRGRIAIHDPVGAAVQRQLLEDEGVPVGDSGLVPLDRFGWLPPEPRVLEGRSPYRRSRSLRRQADQQAVTDDGPSPLEPGARSPRGPRGAPREAGAGARAGSARGASPRPPPRSGSKRRASSSRR